MASGSRRPLPNPPPPLMAPRIYDHLILLSRLLNADVLSLSVDYDYASYGARRLGRRLRGAGADDSCVGYSETTGDNEKEVAGPDRDINKGLPTKLQIRAGISSCYDFLVKRQNVPPECIILCGKGLGTDPALWLAPRLLSLPRDAATRRKKDASSPRKDKTVRLTRGSTMPPAMFWGSRQPPTTPSAVGRTDPPRHLPLCQVGDWGSTPPVSRDTSLTPPSTTMTRSTTIWHSGTCRRG